MKSSCLSILFLISSIQLFMQKKNFTPFFFNRFIWLSLKIPTKWNRLRLIVNRLIMKHIISTILLSLFSFTSSYSANIYSALLSHKTTDNEVFEISFIVQTPATDSVLAKSDYSLTITDLQTKNSYSLPEPTLISKHKSSAYCDDYYPSIWVLEYKTIIDLNDSKYSSLLSSCSVRVALTFKNRAGGTTLDSGQSSDMYIYEELIKCGTHANKVSVSRLNPPQWAACTNINAYFSLQSSDQTEFDSISYELVNPMLSDSIYAKYASGYSSNNPLSVATTTAFKFDQKTGEFIFTPSDTADSRSSVGVLTTEWRKGKSGNYLIIGRNLQEVIFFVQNCPGNNPPMIKAPFTHEICEGEQLCFTISTEDKVSVPPPPLPKPSPDSVSLRWNRGIPSATFTILNPNAQHQSGQFCWTPSDGTGSTLPYTFTTSARDNFCPYPMETVRSFHIYVRPKPKGQTSISRITDSTYSVSIELKDTSNPRITYQLRSIDGSLVFDKNIGYFRSTESFTSTKLKDTLLIKLANDFIIQSTIENRTNTLCKVDNFDTLNYKTLSLSRVTKESFTFFPNPTRGVVNFNFIITDVRVTNCQGQLLIRKESTNAVDLSHLNPGIYYITGFDGASHYSGSVIKY